ncbi:M20/M25/M40 family metallo-hydrolase [Paenibacillus sp. GSMTC-2017]|uniref:M20/M25/M40 family metallo-hydrolase n=1 Tax=Paenibacillus sp. GSMTC-2017 TaxID=2794350 RepID=UPI0018D9C188|nr:M20/M25/M40 family metallo-hydrolase [Paenibacillus sp. GSMTC-2017]MBH5317595.1 M20/M25/M40 family metallo-hydrolase [Paenibacillus sp. GSMTC-2017]
MSKGSLYVIKLGSSTIVNHLNIFGEIDRIVKRGNRVLLVAGGAEAIKQKYEAISRPMPFLTLPSGDDVRYCSPEEMPIIRAAYHENILSVVRDQLKNYGLSVFAQLGGEQGLVYGQKAKPIKAIRDGKMIIVRDSLFGQFLGSHTSFLKEALSAFDVVCLTPPIWEPELNDYINIDADVLAAHLAIDLEAHHLRFVTGTAGLLVDIEDPTSTIPDVYTKDELRSVKGRMKQKVRAAQLAITQGVCDVNISGPHTLETSGKTWFWNVEGHLGAVDLLNKVVRIPSVSQDEHELAHYLLESVQYPDVSGSIDGAGNIVFRKGNGSNTLLLLGHIDTVPHVWPVRTDSEGVTGRGVVDAKGSFVNFIHMLEEVDVPENGSLLVIGAVEEEISSSKGAFFIRDHYSAEAVIIGEPSGDGSLTLGYYGLFKLQITIHRAQEHTAAKDSISAIDELYNVVADIRSRVRDIDPQSLSSLIDIEHRNERGLLTVVGTLNFRVSPEAGRDYRDRIDLTFGEGITIEVLRTTAGYANSRSDKLVKSFVRSFAKQGKSIHYIKKRGTSDMNTLATTWINVPMVAYGPGDASLDHTNDEYLHNDEVASARTILKEAVTEWFRLRSEVLNGTNDTTTDASRVATTVATRTK